MFNDRLIPEGRLKIKIYRASDNYLLDIIEVKNTVVTIGKNLIRDFLATTTASYAGIKKFGIGTGTSTPAIGNSQLDNETYRADPTSTTSSTAQLDVDLYINSSTQNGNSLTEAGLFCDTATATANSGKLYSRATYTAIAKTSSITITYTWTLTWS